VSTARFSKARVAEAIQTEVNAIQCKHRFDPRRGWSQVEGATASAKMDYGAFEVLQRLAEQLELVVDFTRTHHTTTDGFDLMKKEGPC
jgi:hypothetical protein